MEKMTFFCRTLEMVAKLQNKIGLQTQTKDFFEKIFAPFFWHRPRMRQIALGMGKSGILRPENRHNHQHNITKMCCIEMKCLNLHLKTFKQS